MSGGGSIPPHPISTIVDKMRKIKSKVIVYHDETSKTGPGNYYGHVLLFIPLKVEIEFTNDLFGNKIQRYCPQNLLYDKILQIRKECDINHKFHFTNISGKILYLKDIAEQKLLTCAVDALRSKNAQFFSFPLFCKFAIIFYPKASQKSIEFYTGENKNEKRLRYDETLLRMLLKGSVHFLYDDDHSVEIFKIITDGKPNHRPLCNKRIIDRLVRASYCGEVKNHVSFSEQVEIISLDSDHKKHLQTFNKCKHANFLQLADMILGASIYSSFKERHKFSNNLKPGDKILDKKGFVAFPFWEIFQKIKRGSNFQHSSHYQSFSISVAKVVNDQWSFEKIRSMDQLSDPNQFSLFGE